MATLMQYVPILALCMMRPLGMMIMLPLFKGGAMGSGLIRNTLVPVSYTHLTLPTMELV